ncbi:MAG: hypothetical protein ABIH42_04270 [Planctomycetota bacterium]
MTEKEPQIAIIKGKRKEFVGGEWVPSIKICTLCKGRNVWENKVCEDCGKSEGLLRKTAVKLESGMEEAAKKAIVNLVPILSDTLTVAGKQYRIKEIAQELIRATSEDDD